MLCLEFNFCEDNPPNYCFVSNIMNARVESHSVYHVQCLCSNMMCILDVTNQYFLMFPGIKYLNETNLIELTSHQKGPDPYKDNNELLSALYQVFSTPEALGNSFIKRQPEHKKDLLKVHNHARTSSSSMSKEKVRFLIFLIYLYV